MRIAAGYEDLIAGYREGPGLVRAALEGAGAGVFTTRDGDWTVRDILHHLVDRELVDTVRIRIAIATPGTPLPPLPGEEVRRRLQYLWRSPEAAIALLDQLRFANIEILSRLGAPAWEQAALDPDGEALTVAAIVRAGTAHTAGHAAQIVRARGG